jgi:hypothetical protein
MNVNKSLVYRFPKVSSSLKVSQKGKNVNNYVIWAIIIIIFLGVTFIDLCCNNETYLKFI